MDVSISVTSTTTGGGGSGVGFVKLNGTVIVLIAVRFENALSLLMNPSEDEEDILFLTNQKKCSHLNKCRHINGSNFDRQLLPQ